MARKKYLSAKELEQLRSYSRDEALQDERHGRIKGVTAWMVVDTALQTGLRVSEIADLLVGDFNPEDKTLQVHRHKRRVKGKRANTETLAISDSLATHLIGYIAWKASAYQSVLPDAPLFVGKRGALGDDGLRYIWDRAIRMAGVKKIPGVSIHCARHTLGTHLLDKTGNIRLVQKQLGHCSPTVTANMYADVLPKRMHEALNGMFGGE